MDNIFKFILFSLDAQCYALPLYIINNVLPAAEITVLPKSPPAILGVLNIHGEILPVIDIRYLLGLAQKDIHPLDRFIVCNISSHRFIMIVDAVTTTNECFKTEIITPETILTQNTDYIKGIIKQDRNIVFILNIEKIFSSADLARVNTLEKQRGAL